MKTSTLSSIAMVSILAVSSVAFAQGRGGASAGAGRAQAPMTAQGSASTAGTQAKVHTPGTGLLPGATPLQARIHTPGTGLVTPAPVPVPAGN